METLENLAESQLSLTMILVGTYPYIGSMVAPAYCNTIPNSTQGPTGPKHPSPAFSTFPYRRRCGRQVRCKNTIVSIVGPQLSSVLEVLT